MELIVGQEVCIDVPSGKPTLIGVVAVDQGGGGAGPFTILWENGTLQADVPESAVLLALDDTVSPLRQAIIDVGGANPTGDLIGFVVAEVSSGGFVVRTRSGFQYFALFVKYLDTVS